MADTEGITNVLYGLLPWGQTSTQPRWDREGHLTIDVRISSLTFIGTKARRARAAGRGHAATAGHPAFPAVHQDGSPRLFEMTLAHELGHAARIIRRQTLPNIDVEERLVSNLENEYRYARGVGQRKRYGDMELKQYP